MLNSYGQLEIRATKANGALPVKDAIVRIKGAEEENRFIIYSVLTDIDGNTASISLPTPSASISKDAGGEDIGYSIYDIEISKDGYYPKVIRSVPIFPGIKSIQPINMIPLSEEDPMKDYPKGNLNTNVN